MTTKYGSPQRLFGALFSALLFAGCGPGDDPAPAEPNPDPVGEERPFGEIELRFDDGHAWTNRSTVTLHILADKATRMYVTEDPNCRLGGNWERYQKAIPWTVRHPNSANRVFVILRHGNTLSPCIEAPTLFHDNVAPVVSLTTPAGGSWINLANEASVEISGTCSEAGVVQMTGSWSGSFPCTEGTFTGHADLTPLRDGPHEFTFTLADAAGNHSDEIRLNVTKDTVAPTGRLSFRGPARTTSANEAHFDLFHDEALRMKLSDDALCLGGTWGPVASEFQRAIYRRNNTNDYSLLLEDAAGNLSSCLTESITHDDIPPRLSLDALADGGFINSINQSHWTLSGECEGSGTPIEITSPLATTVSCINGRWSSTIDTSSIPDGMLSLDVRHADEAGNLARLQRSIVKDTIPPLAPTVTFDEGRGWTREQTVVLSVLATDEAVSISVSDDESCTRTLWEPLFESRAVPVLQANTTILTSVRLRDTAGNVSPCASTEITHDDIAPVWAGQVEIPERFNSLTRGPQASFTMNATDRNQVTYEYALSEAEDGSAPLRPWTTLTDSVFQPEGLNLADGARVYLHLRARDLAGNEARLPVSSWTVDVTPPILEILEPGLGASLPDTDLTFRGRCESGHLVTVEPGEQVRAPAQVPCPNGEFTVAVSTDRSSGRREITFRQSDGLQESSILFHWQKSSPIYLDGPVLAMAPAPDGGVYVAGAFHQIVDQLSAGVLLTDDRGLRDSSFDIGSGFNHTIRAVVALDDGGYLVGGDFSQFRGQNVPRLVRLKPDGSLDPDFAVAGGPNGSVYSLVKTPDGFFVGGSFTSFASVKVGRLVKISDKGELIREFSDQGGLGQGTALALAYHDGSLYVAGTFTTYRSQNVQRLAKLDTGDGSLDSTFHSGSGPQGMSGSVHTLLAMADGTLLAGGDFTTYRGRPVSRLVHLASDGGLLSSFGGGFNGSVRSLALHKDSLLVGGAFTSYDGHPAQRLVKMDLRGRRDFLFSPSLSSMGFNGTVLSLAATDEGVYAGGSFQTYRSQPARAAALIGWSGEADTRFAVSDASRFNAPVHQVLLTSSGVLWAGAFSAHRGLAHTRSLIRISADGRWDERFPSDPRLQFNGTIHALVADESGLYVGGEFTAYGGQSIPRLAKLRHDGYADRNFHAQSGGANNVVRALALMDGALYAGGDFSTYRGETAPRLARIDSRQGISLGLARLGSGPDARVNTLVATEGFLFVGGAFSSVAGHPTSRIAKVNSLSGELDLRFSPVSESSGFQGKGAFEVFSLAEQNGSLFATGTFSHYWGVPASGLAKLSLKGDPDTVFHRAGEGFNTGGARAIHATSDFIYVSGPFSSYHGAPSNGVLRIHATDGRADLGFSNENRLGGPNANAQSLILAGDDLILGGDFRTVRGSSWPSFVRLNPRTGEITGGLSRY